MNLPQTTQHMPNKKFYSSNKKTFNFDKKTNYPLFTLIKDPLFFSSPLPYKQKKITSPAGYFPGPLTPL